MGFSQDIHTGNLFLQFPWREKVHFSGWSLRTPSSSIPGLPMVHPLSWSLQSLGKSLWAEFNPVIGKTPPHLFPSDPQETLMHFCSSTGGGVVFFHFNYVVLLLPNLQETCWAFWVFLTSSLIWFNWGTSYSILSPENAQNTNNSTNKSSPFATSVLSYP